MWYICKDNEGYQAIFESDIRPECSHGMWTSTSSGFKTLDELIEINQILKDPCCICGNWIESHYYEDVRKQLIAKNMCHSCNIWDERSRILHLPNKLVVEGCLYTIGDENPSLMRGFGGRKFTFIKDDKVIESTNVWYGGVIPDIWKNKFPNNAIAI